MLIIMTTITLIIGSGFSLRGKNKSPDSFSYRKTENYLSFILFSFWLLQNESH